MKNDQFPFLLIEENKNNQEENSDFSDKGSKRSKKKFELKQYEKFKPKNSNNLDKNILYLEGAENKVKSMLSLFLKDIQQENQNSDSPEFKKQVNKIGQKEFISSKFKRKEIKRNSVALRFDPNKFNKVQNNKYMPPYRGHNSGNDLLFNISSNNLKKDIFNKYDNNYSNIKLSNIKNKKHLNNNIENCLQKTNNKNNSKIVGSNIGNGALQSKKYIKGKGSFTDSFIGAILPFKKSNKNIKRDILNDSSSNYNLINSKDLKLNDENNNNKNDYKRIQTSLATRNKNAKKSIHSNMIEQILNNNLPKKTRNSNQAGMLIQSKDKNDDDTSLSLNNFINDSVNDSNAFLKTKEEISITKPTININYELTKKNTSDLNNINHKISARNNSMKLNPEIKNIKRSNTDDKKKHHNPKFFKNNQEFKSIRKILKQSIILRSEDFPLNIKTNNNRASKKRKRSTRSNKSLASYKSLKANNKNKSDDNVLTVKKKQNKFLSLDNANLKNINKRRLSASNKKITIPIPTERKKVSEKKVQSEENSLKMSKKSNTYYPKYRIMRRIAILYDSLDDDEGEDAEEINHLFIHPNSRFILIFDSLLILSACVSFMIVPFYLAKSHTFCRNKKFDCISGINGFIEFIYIMDLLISFFRGYYNWDEQLVYRKRYIIRHYLGKYFLIDLISAVPIYTLSKLYEPICNDNTLSSLYYNNLLNNKHYLLISNRLLKFYKIVNDNQAYKVFYNHLNEIIGMIINILSILLAINYAGCLYIFIARNCYPNWILHTNLDTSSFTQIYICSIYILMMAMTTVGYGDITCYSFGERIFQVFLLIIGIMAYSYVVSSFSNYIQKINEKTADFEKRKGILDEIKLTNPNLPEELYDKILRFLKFKNFHEKKLKSIIFDCLPISLKNNLICEMYKPIIKNFIFFKNFQNTDFIVRVILAFRPILADKNDILINDNDLVEDIMFVKHGILAVELPLNSTNPQENIDKYINISALNGQKGTDIISNLNQNIKNSKFNNSLSFIDPQKHNSNFKSSTVSFTSNIFGNNMLSSQRNRSFGNKMTISEKKEEDDIKYVRILCIRENEHFGDVMMFLEQRSPLRVRVKSRKAELFFLKKMDAIKISASYPNIWRRINKKSVFNFEQIKKSINKIVEIYCSVKKFNSIQEESSTTSIYSELIKQGKIGKEETQINIRPKKFVDKFNMNDADKSKIQKSNSLIYSSAKSLKNILKKTKFDKISDINVRKRRAYSSKKFNINYINIYRNRSKKKKISSLSPKNRKKKNSKKVTFALLNQNEHANNNFTIREEPSKEDVPLSQYKSTKSLHKLMISNNKSSKIEKKENKIKNNNKNHGSSKIIEKNYSIKSSELHESSSIQLINDENLNIFNRSQENSSNSDSYDNRINNEIYPNEEIKVNKEENLFLRRANFRYPIKKYPIKIETNNSIEYKNSKIEFLLKSFDDNEVNKNSSINDSSSNNISNKKKSYNDLISYYSIKLRWENSLSINNNISFKYESSYENCNIISGEKIIKNKVNQLKLKKFLIEEIQNHLIPKRNSHLLLSNKTMNIDLNTQSRLKENEKEKKENLRRQKSLKLKKCISLKGDSSKSVSNYNNNIQIKRIASFNENIKKNKLVKSNLERLSESNNNHLTQRKSCKALKKNWLNTKSYTLHSGLISSGEKNKKLVKKNSYKTPMNKSKKRRDNILSKINLNIQKTNQNLNNPKEFYSNYFYSLLEGDTSKSNKNNLYKMSMKVLPKFKKEKGVNLKKNFTIKNNKFFMNQ